MTLLTNVDPASVQAFHSDAESLSFLVEPVAHWNGTILKDDRSGWLGVPTHLEEEQMGARQSDGEFFLPSSGRLRALQTNQRQIHMNCTFFSFLPKLRPGVPFSTTRHEMPFGPFPPVLHITT